VFLTAAAVAVIGLIVLLFLPHVALRTTSGLEAAAAERADVVAVAVPPADPAAPDYQGKHPEYHGKHEE